MPLLAEEPMVFPPDLLRAASDDLDDRPWLVVHTRARTEKTLARHLYSAGIPYFLPLSRRQWRNQGRLHTSFLPLFPGYVFLKADNDQRLMALESRVIAQILKAPDPQQLEQDLLGVFRLIESGAEITPESGYIPGERVIVEDGSFAGVEGVVVRYATATRLVIQVRLINQAIAVDLEPCRVRPVTARHAQRAY